VDLEAEQAKCDKKLNLARLNLEKIQKVESQPDYENTVPANARLINEDKVFNIFLCFDTDANSVIGIAKDFRSGDKFPRVIQDHVCSIE